MGNARPLLIYDGDCGFCRRWIYRWETLTQGRVDYEPFQTAAARFPNIPPKRFSEAVCFIENGNASWGAQAVLRALAHAPRRNWLINLYSHAPPFAWASEACYRFVARRRLFFSRLTTMLWGANLEPPTYFGARWLFIKAMGLAYLFAFGSLTLQIVGLIGHDGILPVADILAAYSHIGRSAYAAVPTLFWFSASDTALKAVCWSGVGLSVALLLGLFPGPILLALWALYLSIIGVGQNFLSFQWDILLIEAGFLAAFLAPWSPRPGLGQSAPPNGAFLWLLRWLLFRLMFESGCVKLLSGDKAWRSLTALFYHYQTQPLPTWIGWYAHHWPGWFQKFSCLFLFFVELIAPWLIFLPRRPRVAAFGAFILLQSLIALTGNYGFFNLLAVALSLTLLDDSLLGKSFAVQAPAPQPDWRIWAAIPIGALTIGIGGFQLFSMLDRRPQIPNWAQAVIDRVEPFHIVNDYGLFAVMTTTRDEITIEGSEDAKTWHEYTFRWKPDNPSRRPAFVAPYMPRLDWQMWFAALGSWQQNPWLMSLQVKLLEGSPAVLALFKENPFPNAPPRYMRSLLYEYRFTTPAERRATGDWWTRQIRGLYNPVLVLRHPV